MADQGQVIEILPEQYVKVRIERTAACAGCRACAAPCNEMTVIAYNPGGARVADLVTLSLEPEYFLTAALILYGLPLAALLIGSALGYYGAESAGLGAVSPLAGFAAGIAFTAMTYFLIKVFDNKMKKSLYMPTAHVTV